MGIIQFLRNIRKVFEKNTTCSVSMVIGAEI